MPRLLGKRSGSASSAVLTFLLGIVIGAGTVCEYLGVINLVPHFGRESLSLEPLAGQSISGQVLDNALNHMRDDHA